MEEIKVTHGGYVTDEEYVYDCDFCGHTCDVENITYLVERNKKACPCCVENESTT